ncbi:MAG: phosphotyrosine protein phosphatase [Pseudomonadota bacterium]
MTSWINRRFGTWRGLARLLLSYAELGSGRLLRFRLRRPDTVKRVVFVCLGNICRSAYAHQIAAHRGLNVASIGLSTSTGASSPAQAIDAAARQGKDMQQHRATDWRDFTVLPGDLFLVMEVRQAHEVRRRLGARDDVQVCLLGMWGAPLMPHLHDPFLLSNAYFDTCFVRVARAVDNLAAVLPNAGGQAATRECA